MKHQCFSILLTMLFSIAFTKSFAHDLEAKNSDGVTIYYVWTNNNKELGVSFRGNERTSYENEYTGKIVIPESVKYDGNSYSVTSIERSAFSGCNEMTSVSLPNTIKVIHDAAFSGCTGLTSFTMPSSVERSEYWAFNDCRNLTSVHISDLSAWCKIVFDGQYGCNPLEYAHHLFLNDKEITELNIPNDITTINKYAFYGAKYITTVTFPKNLSSIGGAAFQYSGLTEAIIPEGVTELNNNTFFCSNLVKASIPNSVTKIGDSVFAGCVNLESIEIGNGLNKIGYEAFDDCIKLSSVYITDLEAWCNNEHFLDSPFKYGAKLYLNGELVTELIIPNTITSLKYKTFEGVSSITSVVIPNSVISIKENVFTGCSNLNSVDISNSVTSIGSAFADCENLVKVKIGSGVKTIGYKAFGNCKKLNTMYCYTETIPEIGNDDAFTDSPIEQATLYVVDTLIDDYKSAMYWKRFGSILGIESSGIFTTTDDKSNTGIFNLQGNQLNRTQKGLNIIREKNGNTRKIIVK